MGCATSSQQSSSPSADVVSATKRFFQFEEVPLTVKATVKTTSTGSSVLDVRTAGLDKSGLLGALCAGFLERNFMITEASVYAVHGLFNAKFMLRQNDASLRPVKEVKELDLKNHIRDELSHVEIIPLDRGDFSYADDVLLATPSKHSQLKPQVIMDDMKDFSVDTKKQIEEIDKHTALIGASLRVTLERCWTPFIRVAMQKTIEAAGYRVMVAKLSTAERGDGLVMKDIFWLGTDAAKAESSGSGDGQSTPQEWMSGLIDQLQNTQPGISPTKFFARQTSPEMMEVEVAHNAKFQSEVRLAVLPTTLRSKSKELPYKLKLDCDGEQFKGLQKYTGIGMAKTHKGTDVLEFATYFVKKESRQGDAPGRKPSTPALLGQMSMLLGGGEKFAEFVTQYDPTRKCLTVFKVFLNSVLPAKMNAGARAVAEQLLQDRIPDMVGADWNGKAAVNGLTRIHICDVVNWNTYALMSMIGHELQSDTERWLFEEEAKASNIRSLQDLKKLSTEEVFVHTALGKLVQHVLRLWGGAQIASKAIKTVTVQFEKGGQLELICGEYRQMMDIVVTLKEGPDVRA